MCDTEVHAHAGAVVSRGYRHRLHLVAEALVSVGRGVSYTRAAQRARAAAGRDPLTGESAGQMVAEWVDAWAPVVLDALAETEQPETLVLDSTDFWWTNSSTRVRRREFAILVAYGYTGPGKGRVWGIHASPTTRAADYEQLLRGLRLPAPPASIVTDDNLSVSAAVAKVWPPAGRLGLPQPFVYACEHHLRLRALRALELDLGRRSKEFWVARLDTAFRRSEGWAEFHEAALPLRATRAWAQNHNQALRRQTASRHLLPQHYSTSGAEATAQRLRNLYEQRSFSLRNAARTNLLLGLTRLHLNNRDDVNTYYRILREAAEAHLGQPHSSQRLNRDTRGANGAPQPSLR